MFNRKHTKKEQIFLIIALANLLKSRLSPSHSHNILYRWIVDTCFDFSNLNSVHFCYHFTFVFRGLPVIFTQSRLACLGSNRWAQNWRWRKFSQLISRDTLLGKLRENHFFTETTWSEMSRDHCQHFSHRSLTFFPKISSHSQNNQIFSIFHIFFFF